MATTKRLTIYNIKTLTSETNPHYFDRATLRFFGQTMRMFRVQRQDDGRYRIAAPSYWKDDNGRPKYMGESIRYYNPVTNELERE